MLQLWKELFEWSVVAQNTYKDFFLSDQEGSQVEVLKETGGLWLLSLISSVRALRILMDKQPVDDLEGFEYSTVTSFLILQLKKKPVGRKRSWDWNHIPDIAFLTYLQKLHWLGWGSGVFCTLQISPRHFFQSFPLLIYTNVLGTISCWWHIITSTRGDKTEMKGHNTFFFFSSVVKYTSFQLVPTLVRLLETSNRCWVRC